MDEIFADLIPGNAPAVVPNRYSADALLRRQGLP